MAPVEDHDVVETFATARTNNALDVCVLPRRTWCRDDFCDPHRIDPLAELRAVRGIAIAEQIARSGVPRERLAYLTGEPRCGEMLGDGGVNDPPEIVSRNDHHVQQPKRRG